MGSQVDLGRVHEASGSLLRAADQFYTSGRRELVGLLATVGRPATIPDLLEMRPKLTQSSVYRNLAMLETVGESLCGNPEGRDDCPSRCVQRQA